MIRQWIYFLMLFCFFSYGNNMVYANDEVSYFDGIITYRLEKDVFRSFLKNDKLRFIEENCRSKVRYSVFDEVESDTRFILAEYFFQDRNDNGVKKYRREVFKDGLCNISYLRPLYLKFIEFIKSTDNVKHLVQNANINIKDMFFIIIDGLEDNLILYVNAYPEVYFIEFTSKLYEEDGNYKWREVYNTYTLEDYCKKYNVER